MIHHKFLNTYSNASKLFGMEITAANAETGELEACFDAKAIFTNTAGNIQGGILTAMLDDLMGYALGITLSPTEFAPTANLNVSFLRPVKVGRLLGKGLILKRVAQVAYLAAKLYNEQGELVASATSKSKVMHKST